jgi:hypothetical protein
VRLTDCGTSEEVVELAREVLDGALIHPMSLFDD